MSVTLHLGVIDLPYGHQDPARPGRKPAKTPNETTGEVAQILEDKYEIMGTFFALHGEQILDAMAQGLVADMENRAMGAPPGLDPFASAMAYGEQLFRTFLEQKELDGVVGGVPTKASLDGVSHRFKGKKGAPGRPSFVDTGTFSAAFKMWSDSQG